MEVRKFCIYSSVCVIVAFLLHYILLPSYLKIWGIMSVLFSVLPFVIAWTVEGVGIKQFCNGYLSLNKTIWKKAILYVVLTSVSFSIVLALGGYLYSTVNPDMFLIKGQMNVLGVFNMCVNSGPSYICAFIVNIIGVMIVGSLLGVVNCIFEETAWRGFLNKYLALPDLIKPLAIGLIWTIWIIPFHSSLSLETIMWLAAQNIILSYYLDKIAEDTKSVWTGAMIRGIFNLIYIIPLFITNSMTVVVSMAISISIILLIRQRVKAN